MFSKKDDDTEEKITDSDVLNILRLAGASFTIIIICTVVGPLVGFLTLEYGVFLTSIFSVSVILAFPFEAIYSKIFQKLYSIQSNVFIVFLLSIITFAIFQRGSEVFLLKFIGYLFGIPVILSILTVYLLLHKFMPEINVLRKDTYEHKLYFLLYVSLPTIIIFAVVMGILSISGITMGFESLGGMMGVELAG